MTAKTQRKNEMALLGSAFLHWKEGRFFMGIPQQNTGNILLFATL